MHVYIHMYILRFACGCVRSMFRPRGRCSCKNSKPNWVQIFVGTYLEKVWKIFRRTHIHTHTHACITFYVTDFYCCLPLPFPFSVYLQLLLLLFSCFQFLVSQLCHACRFFLLASILAYSERSFRFYCAFHCAHNSNNKKRQQQQQQHTRWIVKWNKEVSEV